ncbi:MAG: squalene/phytoene synthase family protein [Bacteroidales bacterium]|nr:squalene/phytoene synthase family protein [Bacteroidales bacterium]
MNDQYLKIFNKIDFNKIIDHPNILIAAAFWDEDRYQAARTCYKYMRAIDDLIDCHKSTHTHIAESEKKQFQESVENWIEMARDAGAGIPGQHELLDTIHKFRIPVWPLEAFAQSMIYDIDHDGFATINDFINYSQGASVAPASIFVHLNGLTKNGTEYLEPAFDVRSAATPCALFSYFVHIIRDFQKDQMNNLNCFAQDVTLKNGLTAVDLRKIAAGGPVPAGFRRIIEEYCRYADKYRRQTLEIIDNISPLLEPRYRLSLQIIFNLYLMVYEKIDVEKGNFTTNELNPTPDEIRQRVYETMVSFRD